MNRFFEEYSWTLLSLLGGILGLHIIFHCFFINDTYFVRVLNVILENLML